ncbi:hypothetical protein H257_17018, partial [Aphanomyces astaci]
MQVQRILKRESANRPEVTVDTTSCPEWYLALATSIGLVQGGDAFDSFQQCRSRVLDSPNVVVHDLCNFKVCASIRKYGQVVVTQAHLAHSQFLFTTKADAHRSELPTAAARKTMTDDDATAIRTQRRTLRNTSPDPDVQLLTSNIIRAAIMKATGVNTAGTFITNVKKLALDLISGTVAAGYQKLHAYMVQLAEDNGGTYSVF